MGPSSFLGGRAEERTPCPKAVEWLLDVGLQATRAHRQALEHHGYSKPRLLCGSPGVDEPRPTLQVTNPNANAAEEIPEGGEG